MRIADAYDAAARRGYASPMAEMAFERARAAQQQEMHASLRAGPSEETECCLLCQDTLPLCPAPPQVDGARCGESRCFCTYYYTRVQSFDDHASDLVRRDAGKKNENLSDRSPLPNGLL